MSWISHGRGRRSGGGNWGGGVLLSGRLLQRWVFQCGLGPVRIVHCPWLRAKSESARSCLARCRESPSSSILGSQFNENLSLLSQRTLKPGYRIPNQIKLCSSQFSQSITVSVVLSSSSLLRWERISSVHWAVSSYLCIWLLHIIIVAHQTASLEISRIHNMYLGSTYFELVILQTLSVYTKSNYFIFLCFLDSLSVVVMLGACSFTTLPVWQLRQRHLIV